MENIKNLTPPCGQDSFNGTILEAYERADESTRMDMYMTYRELRERFEKIEASSAEVSGSGTDERNSPLAISRCRRG
jgi:hypothetical protein